MSARERAEMLIQAQVKAQQEMGGEMLRTAKPAISRFSNVKVPKGNLARAPPQPVKNVSDHIMREPFHTWEEDEQSTASSKAPPKTTVPEPMKAREIQLQGLPDISSDSDDDPAPSEAVDADSADEGETAVQTQEKTLLPMVSEEELRKKEQQFLDLLQRAKATLKAALFAFAERQQEREEKPVYPELSPIKVVIPSDRSEQLSLALEQVIAAAQPGSPRPDAESAPVHEDAAPVAPPHSSSYGDDKISTSTSSRMYMVEPDAQLAAPVPLAPSRTQDGARALGAAARTSAADARIAPGVRKPEGDSVPPLATERITDQVSFLNIKISKPRVREFDWTAPAVDVSQPVAGAAAGTATPAIAVAAASAEDREDVVTDVVAKPPLPAQWLPANGAIGFDSRNPLGLPGDGPRPVTPLSARSSASREPIPKATARSLSARAFSSAADSKRSSAALQSFVLPKAVHDRMLSSEGSKLMPSPPLEQHVLKLSAAVAGCASSPSSGPSGRPDSPSPTAAAALQRSHSLRGVGEPARLHKEPSSLSMV